jgi:translation initiation factor 2A
MRQDNGIKIFNYHGELIYKEDIPELFSVHWRPHSPELYPTGNLTPPNPNATKVPPLAAPQPYRHPNFSGVASAASPPPPKSTPTRYSPVGLSVRSKPGGTLVGGELDDSPIPEPIKVPKKTPPPQGISDQPMKGNLSYPNNQANSITLSPMNNLQPNPPRIREKSPSAQSYAQKKSTGGYKNNNPDYPFPKEKSSHPPYGPISESEKRRRTLIKKLREIQNLKQKQAAGDTLNPAQLTKMATEAQLQSELDSIPKDTLEGKSPRHYKIENKSPRQYKSENTDQVKTPHQ